jgi:hypothetical protein
VWELAEPPYWLLIVFAVAAHGLRVMRVMREGDEADGAD